MSNTELVPAPQSRTFDQNVAAVVRVLMAMADLDATDLAPRVGIKQSTLYNRMAGKPWLAAELDRIAAYFEMPVSIFYRPVEQVISDQNWKELMGPDLHVLQGDRTFTRQGEFDFAAAGEDSESRHLTLVR